MAKNVLQKHWTGTEWEELHPVTRANNVYADDNATVQDHLEELVDAVQVISTDYVRQPGYAVTAGTATAYTVTLNPAPTAYVAGMGITIVPHVDCGAEPTLNINGLGAGALRDQKGNRYAAGKLTAGKPYTFRRVGTDFLADSGSGAEGDATAADLREGKKATVESGEVITGTLAERSTTSITPTESVQNYPTGIYPAFSVGAIPIPAIVSNSAGASITVTAGERVVIPLPAGMRRLISAYVTEGSNQYLIVDEGVYVTVYGVRGTSDTSLFQVGRKNNSLEIWNVSTGLNFFFQVQRRSGI